VGARGARGGLDLDEVDRSGKLVRVEMDEREARQLVTDAEGAARWYELLLRNWRAADADLPELAEARSGANRAKASH